MRVGGPGLSEQNLRNLGRVRGILKLKFGLSFFFPDSLPVYGLRPENCGIVGGGLRSRSQNKIAADSSYLHIHGSIIYYA